MAKRTLPLLLTLSLLAIPLWAAPGQDASAAPAASFPGKWKLNPSKSVLTDQMKVEAAGPNKYNFIFSGDNVETITVDGTDQPGLGGSTLAVSAEAPDSWKVVRKTNGRITIIGLWKLSPDGKTLTDNFTGYREDGTVQTSLHYIYQRTTNTSGFVGTWESTTEDVNTPQVMEVQPFEGDGLTFINAGGRVVQSLKFDGKDYPGSGASAPAGYVSSGRRINDHAVERVDKLNGKTLYTQQIELSTDGKNLTVTIHIPGRDKPDLEVFDREP